MGDGDGVEEEIDAIMVVVVVVVVVIVMMITTTTTMTTAKKCDLFQHRRDAVRRHVLVAVLEGVDQRHAACLSTREWKCRRHRKSCG